MSRFAIVASTLAATTALDNGVARTPPMGFNSWTAVGTGVSEAFLLQIAQFMNTSGLQAAGYSTINSDDGWSLESRGPDGRLQPDPKKFPNGIAKLSSELSALGFGFGIYTAESSVVCSGRPGSLYQEQLDAQTFAEWGVSYVKNDNCGEYALGIGRFQAFADAANRTGRPFVISTEPFSIVPTPLHARFAHLWRTGNDIDAQYSTIIDRADLNAKWAPFTGPGKWADPDMLQCGHSSISDAECRTHFGLWALSKAPLIIGADVRAFSPTTLSIVGNKGVIAVNQDSLGVQGRKLAAGGRPTPLMVGLAPCAAADVTPGVNGVTAAGLVWSVSPQTGQPAGIVTIHHNESGRCLGTRAYPGRSTPVPVLVPCDASDASQLWSLPQPTTITGLINVGLNSSLTVGDSTVYGTVHGKDTSPLLDAAYGLTNLTFTPYQPEPPCNNRNCDNYVPQQSWYWSPMTGHLSLGMMSANIYRCFEGSCYVLTGHYPASQDYCLSRVAAISNDGVDTTVPGIHVWGGPLSGGAYVVAIENRGNAAANGTALWKWLEAPDMGDGTTACVRELFSDAQLGLFTGNITLLVPSHDIAMLRVVPGASSC